MRSTGKKGEEMNDKVTANKALYLALLAPLALVASLWLTPAATVLANATSPVFAQPPEPQCVCAYCGWPCGSGHASWCKYK